MRKWVAFILTFIVLLGGGAFQKLVHVCTESGVFFSSEACETQAKDFCCEETPLEEDCCNDQFVFSLAPSYKEVPPNDLPQPFPLEIPIVKKDIARLCAVDGFKTLLHTKILAPPDLPVQLVNCVWII